MILDFIQIIELGIIIYLLWRLIPLETQKEIQRKVSKPKGRLIQWTAPEEPEVQAQKKILKGFKKNG